MKRMIKSILAAAVLGLAFVSTADAQPGRRFYVDAGWQFNGLAGNDFIKDASGWGAYAEGGYYVLPRLAVGMFASYNTNMDYIPRRTYTGTDGAALTTDACNSLFQIPFGATVRFRLGWKEFQPYAEAKVGADYGRAYVYCISGDRLHLAPVLQEQFRIPVRRILQLRDKPVRLFRPERAQQPGLQARSVVLSAGSRYLAAPLLRSLVSALS